MIPGYEAGCIRIASSFKDRSEAFCITLLMEGHRYDYPVACIEAEHLSEKKRDGRGGPLCIYRTPL